MDTDQATMLPSGQARDGGVPITHFDQVFSMDEYTRSFGAEHAAAKAAKSTADELKKAPSGINADIPTPGSGPIAISARSSKYTVALHDKYQGLGIPQPTFTFEGSSDRGWNGEVSFPGLNVKELQGIKDATIYSNKKQAKEALSERALEILLKLEKEGRIKKADANTRARASKYMVALHDKFQKLGIPQPFFEYSGSTQEGWVAEVSFPGLWVHEVPGIKNEAPFPNKSEAKEALSELALRALEAAEKEGKLERFGTNKRSAQQETTEKREPGPNYLGQLLEFQRAIEGSQPTYTDYRVGPTRFACQVTIEDGGKAQVFGSLDADYSSKKVARQEAARYAIEYFKSQGRWPDTFTNLGGIKKKTKIQPSLPEVIPSTIPTATPATPDNQQSSIASSSTPGPSPATSSYASQVARLAAILSLPTPEWRFTPNALDPAFLTVQCFFNSSTAEPHQGPLGEVRNVFGKKKAKEECARLTLEYLNEVHAQRLAFGQAMMQGIIGGEEVVEGALGKRMEGEGEAMEMKWRGIGAVEKSSGSDDDMDMKFEDAVEDFEA